jgi:hypothetical protein
MTSQQSLPRLVRLRPARRSAPALPPPDPLLSSHRPPPLAAEWKASWLATPFLWKRSRSHLTVSQSSPCRAGTMAFTVSPFPTSTPSSPASKSGRRLTRRLRRHLPCNVVRISDGLVCPRPSLHRMLIMIHCPSSFNNYRAEVFYSPLPTKLNEHSARESDTENNADGSREDANSSAASVRQGRKKEERGLTIAARGQLGPAWHQHTQHSPLGCARLPQVRLPASRRPQPRRPNPRPPASRATPVALPPCRCVCPACVLRPASFSSPRRPTFPSPVLQDLSHPRPTMMKMMALALAATAGVQAANTSRRQMQDACADLTGDGVVAVADLLALLACASISKPPAPAHTARPPARTPPHARTPPRTSMPLRRAWTLRPAPCSPTHAAPNPSNLATKSSLTNARGLPCIDSLQRERRRRHEQ